MEALLSNIAQCTICKDYLPLGPRPVVRAHAQSKIAIIGQAPGTKVHASGIPWDDASGQQLRQWLRVGVKDFYQPQNFAILPMGFCYPGKGASGDLPPRKECAPKWHPELWDHMKEIELVLLIGVYAQKHYLKDAFKSNLTENVAMYQEFLPRWFPLPHPSPRNRFWLAKNPWFESTVLPVLRQKINDVIF